MVKSRTACVFLCGVLMASACDESPEPSVIDSYTESESSAGNLVEDEVANSEFFDDPFGFFEIALECERDSSSESTKVDFLPYEELETERLPLEPSASDRNPSDDLSVEVPRNTARCPTTSCWTCHIDEGLPDPGCSRF